jgi:hypothetical protein
LFKNCTNLNKRYSRGVGKLRARDKTSGTPVTNFKCSTVLYLIAMSRNRGLDREGRHRARESVTTFEAPRRTDPKTGRDLPTLRTLGRRVPPF